MNISLQEAQKLMVKQLSPIEELMFKSVIGLNNKTFTKKAWDTFRERHGLINEDRTLTKKGELFKDVHQKKKLKTFKRTANNGRRK